MARHVDLELPDGRQRVIWRGHDPVRQIQTGIGPVEVSKPKARGRGAMVVEPPSWRAWRRTTGCANIMKSCSKQARRSPPPLTFWSGKLR